MENDPIFKNRSEVWGVVGSPPALRETMKGVPYMSLQVATHDTFVNEVGIICDSCEWHHLAFYGDLVDVVIRMNLFTSDNIAVVGKKQSKKYFCKNDKVEKYISEVICSEITLIKRGEYGKSS